MSVTVYTNPNCVQCDMTKKVLDRYEIEYSVVDLSQDQDSLQMVLDLGYKQAPVVVAGDKHWSGFKPEQLSNLLVQ
jgi:glutaredoxin-like protein NrdH